MNTPYTITHAVRFAVPSVPCMFPSVWEHVRQELARLDVVLVSSGGSIVVPAPTRR